MAPPSKLAIATSAVSRLVKEEASYHKEIEYQKARIKKLEAGSEDENAEFQLKQERTALEESKAVLGPVREKLTAALANLEAQLNEDKEGGAASAEDIKKAQEVVADTKEKLEKSA